MKKLINHPADVVAEMTAGLVRSYPAIIRRLAETQTIIRTTLPVAKVGLVSGGGSGHEPAHAGFVGQGMLTAAVCGQVFTSPTPDQVYEAIKAADSGQGVLLIIKNYSGDIMNFDMAKEMAEMDGITVDSVVVDDDIAVENSTYTQGRRGVAGTILVHKILGAAAEQGQSLAEIKQLADTIIPQIKTIGLALSGATVPEVGKPGFSLPEDEIEYGVGIHGEPGYRREKLQPARELAKELVSKLKIAFSFQAEEQYAVLVNGLGATPLMEQFIFINDVLDLLADEKLTIVYSKVGNYMTALDMAGISLTLMKIDDINWLNYLNYPATTVAWSC